MFLLYKIYNYDADLEVSDTCVRSSLLSWVELSWVELYNVNMNISLCMCWFICIFDSLHFFAFSLLRDYFGVYLYQCCSVNLCTMFSAFASCCSQNVCSRKIYSNRVGWLRGGGGRSVSGQKSLFLASNEVWCCHLSGHQEWHSTWTEMDCPPGSSDEDLWYEMLLMLIVIVIKFTFSQYSV